MKIDVLGVGFDNVTTEQAAAQASELIRSGGKAYAVTPNPEIVWQCRTNEALRATINGAGLILPDGIGIIIGAKILGRPLRGGRVTGMNFAAALFRDLAATGGSVFLLGAKPGYAVLAGEKLQEEYPGLIIAGAADGYFTDASQIIREVNAANPDLLLVCLGAPKQEFWIAENIDQLNTRLCVGLGGAIDVFAGDSDRRPFDVIAAIDARGFIIGGALACRLQKPLVLVRKKGKLPFKTISESYQLEYGSAEVEVHVDACAPGDRILIVDDLIATGGTLLAAAKLFRALGGTVAGVSALVDLVELGGSKKLRADGLDVHVLCEFTESE